jgi:DegV family protein with EDD domain
VDHLGITVVPAYVQIDNHSYRDGVTSGGVTSGGLSREEFYTRLPDMRIVPTTSAAPAHDFAAAYRSLLGKADEIIALVVSTNLSSMRNVAYMGAQQVPELKIHVIDSEQLSMGLGWMVVAAAEAAAKGHSVSEILDLVEGMKPRTHIYAMLDTLEYVRRSGRVSWARAKAAQILRIKPLIGVLLGEVENVGRARTRHRAIDRLLELVQRLGPLEKLAVLHTYAHELDEFRRRLIAIFPHQQIITVAVTTIIGAHVGPQALGLAAVATK